MAGISVRVFACLLLLTATASAQPVQSVRVGTGFNQPVFATAAPGDPSTLYVVEQGGRVRTLNPTTGTIGATPFLDFAAIPGSNFTNGGSEQGLLGLAFHPTYQNGNGFVYVNYTAAVGGFGGANRVERYTVAAGVVNTASRQTVIEIPHPGAENHNAGWIGFNPANGTTGPSSGYLYVPTGDIGPAQDTGQLLGKILRLDVNNPSGGNNYGIPTGNMTGTGVRPELYSYGVRNPFRGSFDRATGNFYFGDVGQVSREEINFIAHGSPGGQNFGWPLREGTIQTPGSLGGPRPPGNVDPIHDYGRDQGATVIGGYVYRGPNTQLDGTYFFGDFASGKVWSFRYDGTNLSEFTDRTSQIRTATNGGTIGNISSFAEDGFGNLYLIDYAGSVYQLVPVPEPVTVGLLASVGIAWAAGVARWTRRRAGR